MPLWPRHGLTCSSSSFESKMKNFPLTSTLIFMSCLSQVIFGMHSNPKLDFAQACYEIPLPDLVPSSDNRTVPWGTPSIRNGSSTCCDSLDEVRAGINAIDAQLLELLSQRAGFVREATRFKAMYNLVNVPERDSQVIDGAVTSATSLHLPDDRESSLY